MNLKIKNKQSMSKNSLEEFNDLVEQLKKNGTQVIQVKDNLNISIGLEETQEQQPKIIDITKLPERVKISKLLNEPIEGFNVVERGSVLNVFGDPQVDKLVSLDIDIDLSEKFNVVYLFRFKDITFTCKQTKELNHLTIDSFIHNIENINSECLYKLEQRNPFQSFDEIKEMLSRFPKLNNSKFYIDNLDYTEMLKFYKTEKRTDVFVFDSVPENGINLVCNQFKQDRDLNKLFDVLLKMIMF